MPLRFILTTDSLALYSKALISAIEREAMMLAQPGEMTPADLAKKEAAVMLKQFLTDLLYKISRFDLLTSLKEVFNSEYEIQENASKIVKNELVDAQNHLQTLTQDSENKALANLDEILTKRRIIIAKTKRVAAVNMVLEQLQAHIKIIEASFERGAQRSNRQTFQLSDRDYAHYEMLAIDDVAIIDFLGHFQQITKSNRLHLLRKTMRSRVFGLSRNLDALAFLDKPISAPVDETSDLEKLKSTVEKRYIPQFLMQAAIDEVGIEDAFNAFSLSNGVDDDNASIGRPR